MLKGTKIIIKNKFVCINIFLNFASDKNERNDREVFRRVERLSRHTV